MDRKRSSTCISYGNEPPTCLSMVSRRSSPVAGSIQSTSRYVPGCAPVTVEVATSTNTGLPSRVVRPLIRFRDTVVIPLTL